MTDRIFIVGSCVTRDAFEFVANDYTLLGFISRTSLGSAFSDRPFDLSLAQLDPNDEIASEYLKRMIQIDLQKDLAQKIASLGSRDTIIVDLIDERFPLLVSNNTLATCSTELNSLKPTERYPHTIRVKPNTDQHFEVWMRGMQRFAGQIRKQGTRVILNKVQWAESDALGVNFSLPWVREHNAHLQRMYQAFHDEINCLAIEYSNAFVSDPNHKWGAAPFHYTAHVYVEFMSKLDDIIKRSNEVPTMPSDLPAGRLSFMKRFWGRHRRT